MARHFLAVLIFVFSGCYARNNLPMEIWADESFNLNGDDAILAAMDAWKDAISERMGVDPFVFMGFYEDENGFDFDDLEDDIHVIYRIDDENQDGQELIELVREHWGYPGILGYGPHSDILIFWDRFTKYYNLGCLFDEYLLNEDECENISIDDLLEFAHYRLQELLMHELGHFLGLGHNGYDESSIMYLGDQPYPEPLVIPDVDIESICSLYGC